MLRRNNAWQILNDLNTIFDSSMRMREQDDSNVESSSWIPAVDIKEEADKFILLVDIPGVNPKDVDISMENNVLTIKGSRNESIAEANQGYHRVERVKGSFYRRFTLPDTSDADQVTAKSSHGVLEITIGKKKAVQARKISVESSH